MRSFLNDCYHSLKHESNAATQLQLEMKTFQNKKWSNKIAEQLESRITYFENHIGQMNDAQSLSENMPIGSKITEPACKTLVKQRLCQSSMI